jgi:predicted nucleic acid-binding Zn ribbon protein
MHKKFPSYKKTGARNRPQAADAGRRTVLACNINPKSVNDLLISRGGLRRIAAAIPLQQSWAEWVRGRVGTELAGHIVNAVPNNGQLVVFADSAAWGTRLRYALAAMQADIAGRDASISRASVRVQRQSTASTTP